MSATRDHALAPVAATSGPARHRRDGDTDRVLAAPGDPGSLLLQLQRSSSGV